MPGVLIALTFVMEFQTVVMALMKPIAQVPFFLFR